MQGGFSVGHALLSGCAALALAAPGGAWAGGGGGGGDGDDEGDDVSFGGGGGSGGKQGKVAGARKGPQRLALPGRPLLLLAVGGRSNHVSLWDVARGTKARRRFH